MLERTFKKYVEIARGMRSIGSTALDIKNLSAEEAYIITALIKSDAIFNFFDEFKDMDVRELYALIKLCEAKELYEKSKVI